MATTVTFKFDVNELVVNTALGDHGIVDSCCISGATTPLYFVIWKGGAGSWVSESLLRKES
ncbi:MAG: hypothetical protein WC291_07235 [Thermodesulfovibrionales bacterium]|jgi:hypothetical protein